MKKNVIYVGLDVDDKFYHGGALRADTGEIIDFKCRPTVKGLLNQLEKLKKRFPRCKIKICYEATYIGFTLQRDLIRLKYHCDVIAPSSIPRVNGNQIKTDRVDANKMAQFYANGLLTVVIPPDEEQERDRDLLKSRQKITIQLRPRNLGSINFGQKKSRKLRVGQALRGLSTDLGS